MARSRETQLDPNLRSDEIGEFDAQLRKLIVGQPTAIEELSKVYQLYKAGLCPPDRPISTLLYLGPSGVGKTRTVEAASQILFGNPRAFLKIDCAEFQHSHEIAKLIGCFVPGTSVLMADGSRKPIETIRTGDRVISKSGVPRPVLDTYTYQHTGELVTILPGGRNTPVVCTPYHKIWAIKGHGPERPTTREGRLKSTQFNPDKLSWIPASEIEKNDIVVYPRLKTQPGVPVLDMWDHISDCLSADVDDEVVWFREQSVSRFIPVTREFARLAGYYVSEGGNSADRTACNFTYGVPHKQQAVDETEALLVSVFGPDYPVRYQDRSERSSMRLYYASKVAASMFADLFGDHTLNKRVPEWFLSLPDHLLWEFLDTAIIGDGSRVVTRRVDYSTSSETLASQMELILRRLGVTTQWQEHQPENPKWQKRYRIYIAGAQIDEFASKLPRAGEGIQLHNPGNSGIQRMSTVTEDYVCFKVKAVGRTEYTGPVHDISVGTDTSFVVNGIGVKNSPPGYLGHRETPALLRDEVLMKHYTEHNQFSFVLFDEIEKADDALWQLLLGILDKGIVTLGDAKEVNFRDTVVVMTGNLGSREIERLASKSGIGFHQTEATSEGIEAAAVDAARRKFTPEFMNRIDRVVVFEPLKREHFFRILELELMAIQQRIVGSPQTPEFLLKCTTTAGEQLVDEGTDPRYGARHLKRALERRIVVPLANMIATCQIGHGDTVTVDLRRGEFIFTRREGAVLVSDARS